VELAACAISSPVAGLRTASVCPSAASTDSPSMKFLKVCVAVAIAAFSCGRGLPERRHRRLCRTGESRARPCAAPDDLLQVALDGVLVAQRGVVGVEPGALARAPLAQQIPVLVELDPDALEPRVLLGPEPVASACASSRRCSSATSCSMWLVTRVSSMV
jgi:hypothetical protein